MKNRLAPFFLLLVLASSACAGVPLHFGENECSMGGMMDMDCCKAALGQTDTPRIAGADLLCALNCAQNGTTSPPAGVGITPPTPVGLIEYQVIPRSPVRAAFSHRIHSQHGPPDSPPAYLLNLAFLI
jgi:hypothetical protein